MTALYIILALAAWIIVGIPGALIVAAFMGAHKSPGQRESGELADHLGVGGGADHINHAAEITDARA